MFGFSDETYIDVASGNGGNSYPKADLTEVTAARAVMSYS